MKIRMKNFRCYAEKEFDFGDEGLLLLSGPSGSGKSTILIAINFVLFGTGNKLPTFGKTSCQVELEISNFQIKRTKRPNRLVLKDISTEEEYEDDTAQAIINEKLGTTFDVISYLQQNALNSFILMSPTDKLSFLEKFAFTGIDLSKIKSRCQAIIKKRNDELIATTSQLEMATDHFKTLVKPEKQPFPIKTLDKEKAIKNSTIKLKNNRILLKRIESTLSQLQNELNELKLLTVTIKGKQDLIDSLQEKISKLTLEKDELIYEGDDKLTQYEKELEIIISYKELLHLKSNYELDIKRLSDMEQTEQSENQTELDNIEKVLWKDYSKEESESVISDYEQMVKDCGKLFQYKLDLKRYYVDELVLNKKVCTLKDNRDILNCKKELLTKLIIQSESYTCPVCNSSLHLEEEGLCVIEDEKVTNDSVENLEKEIAKLESDTEKIGKQIYEDQSKLKRYKEILTEVSLIEQKYEEELPTQKEAQESLDQMKEYRRLHLEYEKKRKNINEKKFSKNIISFREQVTKQKDQIDKIEKKIGNVELQDEEKLRKVIQLQHGVKKLLLDNKKRFESLEVEYENNNLQFLKLSDESKKMKSMEEIEKQIEEKNKEKQDMEKQIVVCEQVMENIEKYLKYKEELDRYTEWQDKIKTLTEKEKEDSQKYSASTLMKDKILQAESIAMANIINSINTHAQEYLDLFFPSDPIVVRLLPFKQTKKVVNKPQINIEIDYKGMEAELSMLSGGELSRVVLAYTLALSEIFNSPVILLDECTASLDQELTGIVVESLRKNCYGKLVVMICHQVVGGIFDRVIEL